MLAAYPLPTPIIGLLSGLVTPRFGGRRMALAGSALLTVSTLAFALAPNAVVLDLARALQGMRRRHHLGGLDGVAVGQHAARPPAARVRASSWASSRPGAVIGPGVGSFAHATSPLLAFTCLAGVAALTIPLVLRAPAGVTIAPEHSYVRSIGSVLRNRLVLAAIMLSVIDPVSLGAIDLLVPAPPARPRRADVAHRRGAHDRRGVRRDRRARSRAAEPSASARCASALAPPSRSAIMPAS